MHSTCKLTPRQAAFIPEFLATGNATASAIAAGFSVNGASVAGTRMLRNASAQAILQARQSADATRLSLRREDVLKGITEGIEMARLQGNAMAMIRGWSEIARLMGLGAPERVKVDLNVQGQVELGRLNQLSDAELLKIIETGRAR